MTQLLSCARCGSNLGLLRDARVRNDLVCYCGKCNQALLEKSPLRQEELVTEIPEFMWKFFGGFGR